MVNVFKRLIISVLETKANALLTEGKVQQAIRLYDKIIKMNSTKAKIYWNKMAGHITLKEFDQALECIDSLIYLQPDNEEFYCEKASILSLINPKRFEEAIDYCNRAIEIESNCAEAYFRKGFALAGLHQYDEAENCYNKVIELSKENHRLYLNKAIVFLKKKMYQEALELCDKSMELSFADKSNLGLAYFTKSRIYANLNLKNECIDHLKKAIEISKECKEFVSKCEEFEFIKDEKDFIKVML